MFPILFEFGILKVHSFGALVAVGLLAALWLMRRKARLQGFPKDEDVETVVLGVVSSGFLGARILYLAEHPQEWRGLSSLLAFWEGGLVFYGGMIFSFLCAIAIFKWKQLPILRAFDFFLPYVSFIHGFGRLGCFLTGCCGGKRCDLPWAVLFPGSETRVHPTQLYEALFDFCVFAILTKGRRRGSAPGEVTCFYFMAYALGRFGIEFFREGPFFLGPLTGNQWFSLLLFAVAAGWRWRLGRRSFHGRV